MSIKIGLDFDVKKTIVFIVFIIPLYTPIFTVYGVDNVLIYVYPDGSVEVNQVIIIDNPPRNVSVKLIGNPIYVEIYSGNTPISYEIEDTYLTFMAIEEITTIKYIILDLTTKTYNEWHIEYNSPYPSTIFLPEGVLILNISPQNFNISIINNSLGLVFPSGYVNITYIILHQIDSEPRYDYEYNIFTIFLNNYFIFFIIILFFISITFIYSTLRRRRDWRKYMTFKEANNLDERDQMIINTIKEHGELTAKDIIRYTKIPKTPTYRRLKRLVREGYLEAFHKGGQIFYRLKK